MVITLLRFAETNHGTTGVILDNKWLPICLSLELPWVNNLNSVSCIPTGIYPLIKYKSKVHGDCYSVTKINGRAGILFHPANHISQLRGCIACGSSFGPVDTGKVKGYGVRGSKTACKVLFDILGMDKDNTLIVKAVN